VLNQPSCDNEVVAYFNVPSRHLRGSTEHRFPPVPYISVRLSGTHLHAVSPLAVSTIEQHCYLGTFERALSTVGVTAIAACRGDLGP